MDIAIVETGNGGDIVVNGNNVEMVYGIENQPYLAMFGGNKEQSTTNVIKEQSFDCWFNKLYFPSLPNVQFNSLTEKAFDEVPLTSFGRVQIENAIKRDLEYLKKLNCKFKVSVTIVSTDRIDTIIEIIQGENKAIVEVNYKKNADGDFFIFDFNNDWFL